MFRPRCAFKSNAYDNKRFAYSVNMSVSKALKAIRGLWYAVFLLNAGCFVSCKVIIIAMESGLLFYKGYGKLRPMTGKKYGYFLCDNSKL